MNAKFMLWKRAVRVVLFGLLLNVVGMTKGYSNYDFSARCATGQTLYFRITAEQSAELTYPRYGEQYYSAWEGYTKPSGEIILPETVMDYGRQYTVKSIGERAFVECTGLTGITIPNSVITIGDEAFGGCTGLTGNLIIPNSVTTIGDGAFAGCTGLTGSLNIPGSVTSIGERAFSGCAGFTSLIIPTSVTTINNHTFFYCTGFTGNLVIPATVTSIGESAFEGCSGFTGDLVIPNSITSIGNNAFSYCTGLTGSLTIPNSVSSMGSAFMGCVFNGLYIDAPNIPDSFMRDYCREITGNLHFGNSVITIGEKAFEECTGLTGLTFSNSVTTIGERAFFGCTGFTGELTIGNAVTTIGESAFERCSGFSGSLSIPNSVTTIGPHVFYDCTGITGSLTIPNSVTSLGDLAFYNCSFNGLDINTSTITAIAFYGCDFTGSLTIGDSVNFIEGGLAHKSFTGDLVIPNSVTTIGEGAFENCSFDGSLTIPNSVTSIGRYAFAGCSFNGLNIDVSIIPNELFRNCESITGSLVIGNSVITIGEYAFDRCSNLTGSLTIPNTVTSIGDGAFRNCSGFTGSLTIPNSVTEIGSEAFSGCNGFTDLTIGTSVTSIGEGAFRNSNGFTGSLIIPNSMITIGDYAFMYCTGFSGDLTIGNSVTSIGNYAFAMCSDFTGNLTLGNSVDSIGNYAFWYCSGFTGDLNIPNSITSIGKAAFAQCNGFTGNLTLGNALTSIGENAFEECNGFTGNLVIPNSVSTIGKYAFLSCSGFNGTLTLPDSLLEIGEAVFSGCSGFTGSLTIPDSVTSIGSGAFSGCSSFTGDLVIPNSVSTIGESAFYGCNGFTGSLTIPNSVTQIEGWTFWDCTGFSGDLVIPNSVTRIWTAAFSGCIGLNGTLTLPNSLTEIGERPFSGCSFNGLNIDLTNIPSISNNIGGNYSGTLTLGNSVITIEESAFDGCSGFTGDLIIPNSVTTIGNFAFRNCTGFSGNLTIGNSVTSIGISAFNSCNGFRGNLSIGNSVATIGNLAFYNCSGLTGDLVIPNSVTTMGGYVFGECSGFTGHLYISNALTSIYYDTFFNCSGLTGDLVIPNSVTLIGESAFKGCSGFTGELIIPNSVTTIDQYAFQNCSGFTGGLTIGNSVTIIGKYAFDGCSGFTGDLALPNSLTKIGHRAFQGCTALTGTLTIPENVTWIGMGCFVNSGFTKVNFNAINCTNMGCDDSSGDCYFVLWQNSNLQEIIIGENVTQIPDYAFGSQTSQFCRLTFLGNRVTRIGAQAFIHDQSDDCGLIGDLVIPSSVTEIGDWAFYGCYGITSIHSYGAVPPTTGNDALYEIDYSIPVYVPLCSEEDYRGANQWSNFTNYWAVLPCPHTFTGNGADNLWSNPDNWHTQPNDDNDIIINAICEMDENVEASRIVINSKAKLVIKSGYTLDINGNENRAEGEIVNLGSAQNLIIEDGGQLFYDKDGLQATVKKTILPYNNETDGWNLMTYPMIGNGKVASQKNLLSGQYDLYYYDEPTLFWNNYKQNKLVDGTSSIAVFPFYTYYNYSISENLFLARELADIGLSTEPLGALCWYATNSTGYEQSNISIWMANVSDDALTESSHLTNDMTLVYFGNMTPEQGWNEFVFNENNFAWDGTSNVLICVQRNNGEWNNPVNWQSHETDFAAMSYDFNDNSAYDMVNQTYSMSNSSIRPNIVFEPVGQIGDCFTSLKAGKGYLYANDCVIPATETQVGNSSGTQNYFPFYTYYENSISECLFRAEELENAGVAKAPMTSLSWYATNRTGYLQSNISIWMANVSENALSGMSHNPSNMTLVYTGAMTPEIGWNEFVFNEDSFAWDEISNVLVCIQRNNGEWNNPIKWQSHNCGFVGMSYLYQDNTPYDVMNETYSMNTSTSRPTTIFKTSGQEGEPITISFKGQLQRGTAQVTIPLSYTESIDYPGYNLVGNPFVHNVTSYASENVADGCFRLNETQDDIIVSEISEAHPLKPAEGFFVKATGENASITFNPQAKAKASQSNSIRLEIMENGHLVDRLIVKKEGEPLEKLSLKPQRTKLFANKEDKEMAIVSVDANEQAISFKATHDGTYTLTVNADKNEGECLHLIDNLTGEDIDLLAALRQAQGPASYTFEAKTTDDANRFKLVFSVGGDANVDDDRK